MLSTVLQGFYQSHQATAAAVAVHNLHLLRGMIGRPGAGVLQMNGQPTAQNNRECGADGDLPGFRNWDNPAHVQELADLWNVDAMTVPHWAPPTHAMQIMSLRRDRLDRPAVDLGHEPGGLHARVRADPPDPGRGPVLHRRPGPVPDRDRGAGRRRAAGRRLGREDRLLHQRQPHRPPLRAGGAAARRGPLRPRHLPGLRGRHGVHRPGRGAAAAVAHARGGVRRLAGGDPGPPGRLHRAVATTGSADPPASRGRSTTSTPTAPTGSTPTASSRPTPTSARPTGTTC